MDKSLKSGYFGRISNAGVQVVKAVNGQNAGKGASVKKGGDQRAEKSKG
jgi:hypothetical protein